MKLINKTKEYEEYGRINNLVCVDVCLPKFNNSITFIKNEILSLLESCKKTGKFINASDFNMIIPVKIHKKGMEKILESNKMKAYFSNNDNNEMFLFKNKDKYVILSPEKISETEYEDNEKMLVLVDKTPYRIWLKMEELNLFLEKYNELINRIVYFKWKMPFKDSL